MHVAYTYTYVCVCVRGCMCGCVGVGVCARACMCMCMHARGIVQVSVCVGVCVSFMSEIFFPKCSTTFKKKTNRQKAKSQQHNMYVYPLYIHLGKQQQVSNALYLCHIIDMQESPCVLS